MERLKTSGCLFLVSLLVGCGSDPQALAFPAAQVEFLLQGSVGTVGLGRELVVNSDESPVVFSYREERANVLASGAVRFTGADCADAACPIEISSFDVTTGDFELSGDSLSASRLTNKQAMSGVKRADGSLIIDRISVLLSATANVDGKERTGEFFPEDDVTGTISADGARMTLWAQLVQTGSTPDDL